MSKFWNDNKILCKIKNWRYKIKTNSEGAPISWIRFKLIFGL